MLNRIFAHARATVSLMAVAAFVTVASASAVKAQGATFTFVGETGGDDVSLLLGDINYVFTAGTWSPVLGLQAFLVMDEATDSRTLWSVNPAVGFRHTTPQGFVQGLVGFAWAQVDDAAARVPFFGGGDTGMTTSLHTEWWGDGRFGAQGIAAYNWGAEYLWSRLRGTARVFPSPSGDIHLGLEGGWQGDLGTIQTADDPRGRYSAIMVGPIAQWRTPNVTAGLGAGWKQVPAEFMPGDGTSTWYFRAELVFTP